MREVLILKRLQDLIISIQDVHLRGARLPLGEHPLGGVLTGTLEIIDLRNVREGLLERSHERARLLRAQAGAPLYRRLVLCRGDNLIVSRLELRMSTSRQQESTEADDR